MTATVRTVRLGDLGASLERRADGSMLVRSTVALPAHPDKLTLRLEQWAVAAPDRTFLAKREAGGDWRRISYAETLRAVRSLASGLLERNLAPDRPIMLLSGNDIEHALLTLAAMYIGVLVAPISPAYALISSDYGKLKFITERLRPQLVFAADGARFAAAIAASCPTDVEVIATRGTVPTHRTTAFAALLERPASAAVDDAHAAVGPETVAKILFTSGSTGMPKGVINTQRMLMTNQAMLLDWLPFLVDAPPVLLDWLPWNHTFGGNHNVGLVLSNGGTMYIDDGKPTPAGIAETVRNLGEISPTIYFNVPKGYEELVTALGADPALCRRFFSTLQLAFYAGASLSPHIRAAFDRLAVEATGSRVLLVTGFGSTETAPGALGSTLDANEPGNLGRPLAGVTVKLVVSGDKLEARLRSPSLTPGYWQDADATAKAFDEEGFYRFGDAFRFVEDGNPARGFYFDGRTTEDFKLSTGTWVSVGPLRARIIAAWAPLVKDVVITGHDRDFLGALVFPDIEACRALLPAGERGQSEAGVFASAAVRAAFADHRATLAAGSTGSSTKVVRLIVLGEPPSIDANEITDKGSINQRAVLSRRATLVDELYAVAPDDTVISG
jgi:feruloyl-CoA synthase